MGSLNEAQYFTVFCSGRNSEHIHSLLIIINILQNFCLFYSFLNWDLTEVIMRQMVICWLRLMCWPMTVLLGIASVCFSVFVVMYID